MNIEKLKSSAPPHITGVLACKIENRFGLRVYAYDTNLKDWKKKEVDYETAFSSPSTVWDCEGDWKPAEDFQWGMLNTSRKLQDVIKYLGHYDEYCKAIVKFCGQPEDVVVFALTPQQLVDEVDFALDFIKSKTEKAIC